MGVHGRVLAVDPGGTARAGWWVVAGAGAATLALVAVLGRRSRHGAPPEPLAAAGERGRMALELHDSLARAVGAVLLQSAGARRVLARDPQRADHALADVGASARQASEDLRRLWAVLRAGPLLPPAAPPDSPPPPSGPDRLLDLTAHPVPAGVDLRTGVAGRPGPLDDVLALTVRRLVGGALAVVAESARPGATITVRQTWTPALLIAEITGERMGTITSARRASPAPTAWAGLHERARLCGGGLEVEPRPDGIHVRVALPLPRPAGADLPGAAR